VSSQTHCLTNFNCSVITMPDIRNELIPTETFDSAELFRPPPGSTYIYGLSHEDRSGHVSAWQNLAVNVRCIEISDESQASFRASSVEPALFLRSSSGIERLFEGCTKGGRIYIDTTGLTHPVWAAILRAALVARFEVLAVYVEPDRYVRSSAPVEGQIYDLSMRITGIAPMPGFTWISATAGDFVFVPLLGFEGTRLRHVIEQVQPSAGRVVPVIGAPGFKPWYVFETYAGNRAALEEDDAWEAAKYAPANCPFSCYYLLQHIARQHPSAALKVAMIGTKPHALGAVLFAITNPEKIELVYDHPIRKPGRTEGTDRLYVYHVSAIARGATAVPSVRTSA
jgi:hypothetical protein